ncbi:glutathione-dependent formaldehyde-activating GFA, partial [Pseudomassariella vexata]
MPPTPDNFAKPEFVTGGCLCGSVRYKVDFPPDHDFLKASGSCQCTQCRRNTGSLIFYAHDIRKAQMSFLTSTSTLENFEATPGCQRSFCTKCGSFLYWADGKGDEVGLAVGTVDPEFLVGDGEKGEDVFAFALANTCGANLFCENEIKGVT